MARSRTLTGLVVLAALGCGACGGSSSPADPDADPYLADARPDAATICGAGGPCITVGGVTFGFDADGFDDGVVTIAVSGSPYPTTAQLVAASDGSLFVHVVLGHDIIVKLAPDGHPDPTFGDSGVYVSQTTDRVPAIAVRPDGRVLMVAIGTTVPLVARQLDATGQPDPTFGVDGTTVLDIGGAAAAPTGAHLALDGDGSAVIAGTGMISSGPGSFLARVDATGAIVAVAASPPAPELILGLLLDDQGRPVISGNDETATQRCFVGRMTTDLVPDTTFANGSYSRSVDASSCFLPSVRAGGGFTVSSEETNPVGIFDVGVVHFLDATGQLDSTVADGGLATVDGPPVAVKLAPDGNLLVAFPYLDSHAHPRSDVVWLSPTGQQVAMYVSEYLVIDAPLDLAVAPSGAAYLESFRDGDVVRITALPAN